MGIDIYVATGKPINFLLDRNYYPLLVGLHDNGDVGSNILRDITGESIANKNLFYCELTGLYWVWKNRNIEKYIGLCHYRRFFFFQDYEHEWILKYENHENYDSICDMISTKNVENVFKNYDIILPVSNWLGMSVEEHYERFHRKNDLEIVKKVVEELYPEYILDMEDVLHSYFLHCYNMFVMSKEQFSLYMEWLFSILFEVENRILIPINDPYQRRVFGFIAERLLNIYVQHHHLRVKEVPVVFLTDNIDSVGIKKNWKYKTKRMLSSIIPYFMNVKK